MAEKEPKIRTDLIQFWSGAAVGGFLVYWLSPFSQMFSSKLAPTACEMVTSANDDRQMIVDDAIKEQHAIVEELGPEDGIKYYYQINSGAMPQELEDFVDLAEEMAEDCSSDLYLWHYPTLREAKARSEFFYPDGTPRK